MCLTVGLVDLLQDIVLHHVMSIFTYMGANIMRQDDMYSFQIITNTLDTVVPEIVKVCYVSSSIVGMVKMVHYNVHYIYIYFMFLLVK